ncbi:MAG TPA: site-specific integrase [Burkholderiales bacterium]|nr:site-specific integrase [Burkholderiales bacterium]
MLESLVTRPHDRARLRAGPMHAHLAPFARALLAEDYRPRTVRRYLFAADAFGRWLQRRGVAVQAADDATVARYVESRGRFRCGARPRGRLPDAASGARKLLDVLRQHGVVAPRPCLVAPSDTDRWFAVYDRHLDRVAGLCEATRRMYARYARALAALRFGSAPPDWSMLTADDVAAFVRQRAQTLKPSACRLPGTATRALLRFLESSGAVREGLRGAVPAIRQWKHASLPRYLSADEVARVLAASDAATPQGRRDCAIVALLARLGLRAGEVAGLRLDDLDWTQGRVCIRGAKSGRDRSLPLAQDIGDRLVAYLRHGRPATRCRHVFLRALPPYGPLRGASSVSAIVERAARRAGIDAPRRGAHTLRHSAATWMVRRGASFKQVADVLGHARLETTGLYAKLDIDTLARVALPWPGGAR